MTQSMYNKDDYNAMARDRLNAFREIATTLGKDHKITKMMGSLAWGRHDAEQGTYQTLQTAVREMSFLDGYFNCLKLWARDNDYDALHIMINVYPSAWRKAK